MSAGKAGRDAEKVVLTELRRQVEQVEDANRRAGCDVPPSVLIVLTYTEARALLDHLSPPAAQMPPLVHDHPPYRPTCNERLVGTQLRGACLNDDGAPRAGRSPEEVDPDA